MFMGVLLSSLPNGAGVIVQGMVLAKDRGAVQGDPIGGDLQSAGAGEALLGDHEPGIAGSTEQAGGRIEQPIAVGVGNRHLHAVHNDAALLIVGRGIHGGDQGNAAQAEQTIPDIVQVQIGVTDVLGVDGGVLRDLVQVGGDGIGLVGEPTGKDLAGAGEGVGHQGPLG